MDLMGLIEEKSQNSAKNMHHDWALVPSKHEKGLNLIFHKYMILNDKIFMHYFDTQHLFNKY